MYVHDRIESSSISWFIQLLILSGLMSLSFYYDLDIASRTTSHVLLNVLDLIFLHLSL